MLTPALRKERKEKREREREREERRRELNSTIWKQTVPFRLSSNSPPPISKKPSERKGKKERERGKS
jgi:hypothetical protein